MSGRLDRVDNLPGNTEEIVTSAILDDIQELRRENLETNPEARRSDSARYNRTSLLVLTNKRDAWVMTGSLD